MKHQNKAEQKSYYGLNVSAPSQNKNSYVEVLALNDLVLEQRPVGAN